jgi:hypothetical protein
VPRAGWIGRAPPNCRSGNAFAPIAEDGTLDAFVLPAAGRRAGATNELEDGMRSLTLLLGLSLAAPLVAQAQRPEPDRPRGERREVIVPREDWSDGPEYRYRYGRDDDDDAIREYRNWTPRLRCNYNDRACERRLADLRREEAKWRREAREREQEFQRDMAERERKFREKELERWRKHEREMRERAGRYGW